MVAATVRGRLHDLGDYPGLVMDGSENKVTGEVYEVDAETLSALDEFEATADFSRVQTTVSIKGKSLTCWVYCPAPDRCLTSKQIDSGDWIEYAKSRSL